MARSKQAKKSTDGKHRKETRTEKRIRLQQQEEAREICFRIIPYVGGVVAVFLLLFGIYVSSVPPKQRVLETTTSTVSDMMTMINPDGSYPIPEGEEHEENQSMTFRVGEDTTGPSSMDPQEQEIIRDEATYRETTSSAQQHQQQHHQQQSAGISEDITEL